MNEFSIGSSVVIANTRFDSHRAQIGKRGVITKFIKSRGLYQIRLDLRNLQPPTDKADK